MGNKKSTPKPPPDQEGSRQTKHPQGNAVKLREAKQGKKKKERPFSDSAATIRDDVTGPNFDQFYLKPTEDISGKRVAGISTNFPLPLADYDLPNDQQPPTGAQVDLFKAALDDVLKIWPEYHPVKQISVHDSTADLVGTLQQIANRLCQQHNTIKRLSGDYHEMKQVLEELQEERDSLKQMITRRDEEADRLKEERGLLLGELKRRGLDYKLPPRNSNSNTDYELDTLSPRSDMSNYSSLPREEESGVGVTRKPSKLFAPTPLIMAEGGRSRQFLEKRVKNLDLSHSMQQEKWAWPESNAPDDLKERVKWLQAALDSERERNRDRATSSPKSPGRHNHDSFVKQFRALQHEAFDKVKRQVMNSLVGVSDDRQLAFISSIVVESYTSAQDIIEQFQDAVISLLVDPTKPQPSQRNSLPNKAKRNGSIMDNVRKFEYNKKHHPMLQEKRRFSNSEVPEQLMDQIFDFLEGQSSSASISTIAENTIDGLRREYSDCLTPSLLNHSVFTSFLHSVCRLSWQLSLQLPPLYITDDIVKFEGRYHETDSGHPTPGESIQYYLWPILLSKKHGEILSKGIVAL